jgi:LPS sulfotransferase NodH
VHPSAQLSYLIYATSRSGSTLLCDLLESTGLAGRPDEYFNEAKSTLRKPEWELQRTELSFPDYVDTMIGETMTPNGVFGAKFGWARHLEFVSRMRAHAPYAGLADQQILDMFFPNLRYIFVTRRDKVRQAVSSWKAIQTDQWNTQATWVPRDPHRPLFSFPLINELLQQNVMSESVTSDYFAQIGVVPLTVVYEDLALDPVKTMIAVLTYLDVEIPDDFSLAPPRMSRQTDVVNDDWVRRYHSRKLSEMRVNRLLGLPTLLRNPRVAQQYLPDRAVQRYRILRGSIRR